VDARNLQPARTIVAADTLERQIRKACKSLQADWSRAKHLADVAGRLFEATRHINGLTKTARGAVRVAAMCQELLVAGAEVESLDGIVEAAGLPEAYQEVAAEAIRLARPRTEVSATIRRSAGSEGSVAQETAIRLAAVLRVATGLDHSRSQSTRVAEIYDSGREIRIVTSGRASAEDAASAQSQANLWNDLLLRPVQIAAASTIPSSYIPVLDESEPMAWGLCRILQRQAEQLWSRQYGASWDHDTEFVHEMRVATRRVRTALRLGRGALGAQADYWRGEFGWLADLLGTIRDLDVLMAYVSGYIPEAPKTHTEALEEFIGLQVRKRKAGRTRLLKALGSGRYEKLRHGFGRALMHPVGSLQGLQAVGPRAQAPFGQEARRISAAEVEALKQVPRDISELSSAALHELRIACKRLRYTLEFFQDVLPGGACDAAATATKMQDALGEVHDADVWSEIVAAHAGRREDDTAVRRACKALIKQLGARREQRLAEAEKTWSAFRKPSGLEAMREMLAGGAT